MILADWNSSAECKFRPLVKGGNTYRILSDHLGSVRFVVNTSTGAVAQRLDYDEFGNITADTNPGFEPFAFAGGIYDPDTGLTRFGARDYDPAVGRWTTKDPIRFDGGLNLYGYVMADPVNFIDPLGLYLHNGSRHPIVVKPEHSTPISVGPHSHYPGAIDGAKPPGWGGDWYKVPDGDAIEILPDGTPIRVPGDGIGGWVPDFPDAGGVTDRLPGRKSEPGFSDRNGNFGFDPCP